MSQRLKTLTNKRRAEPYWYLIAVMLALGAGLFIYHQVTDLTPDRVAFHISSFNFDVFWYGVIIVTGIALGTYVTSKVVAKRADWIFQKHVPKSVQALSITKLSLPKEISRALTKRNVSSMGQLVFEWGLNPGRLGLNKAGRELVEKKLTRLPKIKSEWLEDAPWRQWNPDFVWSGVAWCLAFGVVGARFYHILTPSPSMADIGINSAVDYFRNPLQLINLRNGGLGIYGALVGGALGIILFTKRHRLSAIAWTDLAVVGLALGQSIGRWANFINQELYGSPSNLPWAITIDPAHRLPEYINFARFHPTFLYASIWSFITFLVLLWLAQNKRESILQGDLTALYLIMFSFGRIVTELFRLDSRLANIPGLKLEIPVATLIAITIIVILGITLIWRHVKRRNRAQKSS
jgi:phosphatidylglycerol:prolipoprotein diacylglycerol transferase